MDSRAVIIASCWLAVALISSVTIWLEVTYFHTYSGYFVMLLVLGAFIVTFGVAFGFRPERTPEIELLSELQNIRSRLEVLTREVEDIKKTLEE